MFRPIGGGRGRSRNESGPPRGSPGGEARGPTQSTSGVDRLPRGPPDLIPSFGIGLAGQRGAGCYGASMWSPLNLGDFRVESGVREVPEGSILDRFSAELCPEIPLDRRGSSYSACCTKNQPRRPCLRPFRGDARVLSASKLHTKVWQFQGPPDRPPDLAPKA